VWKVQTVIAIYQEFVLYHNDLLANRASEYRYMKYIALKPNRLHCKTCDETYSLPLNGNIKLYKELRCV
jgi:hypothetical protein